MLFVEKMSPTKSTCFDMNKVGFFEGAEKLLEIWFEDDSGKGDLRMIPRVELEELLMIIRAEIVNVTKNESIDSYVLSESSMFISKNRFIIKTCGITRLLYSVDPVIKLAKKYAHMSKVQNFFYSRRVFLRPEEQSDIHKKFDNEVDFLEKIIPGTAYVLGRKKSEQWYLFTMDNMAASTPTSDVTLEILMSDLDPQVMSQFSKITYQSSEELVKDCGISQFIPGSMYDALIFDPIGFSLNGLYEDSYYTIHVTPQDMCSYVSFETNLFQRDYTELINKVITTFKPGKFIITLFSTKDETPNVMKCYDVKGYKCKDQHDEELKNYWLIYQHYVRI